MGSAVGRSWRKSNQYFLKQQKFKCNQNNVWFLTFCLLCIQIDSLGQPYDFESVMHYGSRSFSKNLQDTIVPKNGNEIGHGRVLSVGDILQTNLLYRCSIMTGGKNFTRLFLATFRQFLGVRPRSLIYFGTNARNEIGGRRNLIVRDHIQANFYYLVVALWSKIKNFQLSHGSFGNFWGLVRESVFSWFQPNVKGRKGNKRKTEVDISGELNSGETNWGNEWYALSCREKSTVTKIIVMSIIIFYVHFVLLISFTFLSKQTQHVEE